MDSFESRNDQFYHQPGAQLIAIACIARPSESVVVGRASWIDEDKNFR